MEAERPKAIADGAVRIVRDVVYREVPGDRETLDLYLPTGPAPAEGRPVILAIHGGGWRKFRKEDYAPTVAPFAKLGYIVAVPNYRLSTKKAPSWPTNFEDVRDAVRWVRSHSGEIGADPGRIAAMGESAGGHLAAMLGTYPDGVVHSDAPPDEARPDGTVSARVQAVVDFYGPTDLAALDARGGAATGPIRRFLGDTPNQAPSRYEAASPISHVSGDDPPFLIVQGADDELVNPSQSRGLADRLSAAGVPNRLIVLPGEAHGFGLHPNRRDLFREIAGFLATSMR